MELTVATPSAVITWIDGDLYVSPDSERARVEQTLTQSYVERRAEPGDNGSIAEVEVTLTPGTFEHARAALSSLHGAVLLDDFAETP